MRAKNTSVLFFVLCFQAAISQLSAQAFTQIYRPLGISNQLFFSKVAPAPNNGYYVAGEFGSDQRITVARLDAQGKPVWVKVPDDDRSVYDLAVLKDGSVLVFNNNGSYHEYFDASVLHLGADGSFISENIWGDPGNIDRLGSVVRLASGEYLASGTVGLEDGAAEVLLLVKFSETGKVLWSKTWDQGGFGGYSKPIEIPGGGFYTVAHRLDDEPKAALCRFDSAGVFMWAKTYDFGEEIWLNAGLRLPDGTLVRFQVGQRPDFGQTQRRGESRVDKSTFRPQCLQCQQYKPLRPPDHCVGRRDQQPIPSGG
jgi:hypothetical protein